MSKTLAVILLISLFALYIDAATDYFSTITTGCSNSAQPRVRKVWKSLDDTYQQAYVKTVVKMKATLLALKQGSTSRSSLYNLFVQTHYEPWNSKAWHGTPLFLPVHKWYLWNFESALIYTAVTYYSSLGITKDLACSLTLPYWDWETDFDTIPTDAYCPAGGVTYGSLLLESEDFGSQAGTDTAGGTYTVNDGKFSSTSAWSLWMPVYVKSTDTLAQASRLKRQYNCASYALKTSSAMIWDSILAKPSFSSFTSWLEGIPHGWPHMNMGFSMSMMYSPDDPLFMLHHCNIDRIYTIWQDCYDYEQVDKGAITTKHFNAGTTRPYNPVTGLQYVFGNDSPMPYVMSSTGSQDTATPIYSVVFGDSFPTPRDMWPSINGHKGLNVRYGPDALVKTFDVAPKSCTLNTGWRIVNQGSKKRDLEEGSDDPNIKERIMRETNAGKSVQDVIHEIAMEDCLLAPPLVVDEKLMAWIRMNGLHISQFDTICDKVSERVNHETGQLNVNLDSERESGQMIAPVWVIVTASIGCTLVLVAVITLIVLYLRRRNAVDIGNSYTEMRE